MSNGNSMRPCFFNFQRAFFCVFNQQAIIVPLIQEDIKEDNMLESEDTYLILEQTQNKDGRSARCPWDSESKLCGRISGKWAGFDIHGIRITGYFFLLFVLHHRKVTIQSPLHRPRSYSGIGPFQRQGPWDGTWPQSWAGGPWPSFAPVRS